MSAERSPDRESWLELVCGILSLLWWTRLCAGHNVVARPMTCDLGGNAAGSLAETQRSGA